VALTSAPTERPRAVWVLVACALILAPTLTFRMGVDQGSFAYMGAGLLQGKWPYLHTWESDFPGLVFLQAGEMALLGKSGVAFRAFDLVVQLANAYLLFRLASRVSTRIAAVIAPLLFCLIYQGYGPWNTAQREGFGLFFVLAGYWLYLTAGRRAPVLTAAGIGLGLGLAVTIKPTLLALALFYAPLVWDLRSRRAVLVAVAAIGGLLAPASLIVIGYWAAGGMVDLYEACIAYQSVYTVRLRGEGPFWIDWMHRATALGLHASLLLIGYVPFLFARHERPVRAMVWLGYAGAVYSVWVQGTFAGYHYLPGLALGSVLVSSMFALTTARWSGVEVRIGRRRAPVQLLLAMASIAAVSPIYLRHAPVGALFSLRFLGPPLPNEFRNEPVFDFTESYDVAAYLRARTGPDERIQIWGYEPLVYYLAERFAASRFPITHPLVMRPPGQDLTAMQRRWRAEFITDLSTRPPAYIAVVRGDHWWWAPEEKSSEELLHEFPELNALIDRQYTLDQTIGRFLVCRRLSISPAR
jgi:hypothetical protein